VPARRSSPRVVTTSSVAHRTGRIRWDDLQWERGRYSRWLAYGQSKLANLLFAFELDRRAGRAGTELVSVAAHPGYAATHLQQAGPEMEGNRLKATAMGLLNRVVAQSDADGALPQLYAATMPDVAGGEYWGPDGPAEVRGGPRRVGATKQATDEVDAARLWDVSEELTGVRFAWPHG
jgi:protochlorophyllide reductase